MEMDPGERFMREVLRVGGWALAFVLIMFATGYLFGLGFKAAGL